ncbi:MAG: hypothetical protein HOV81_24390 [Kofleriaceae bacterium]|nr:hypothetical protein [Kofleriaceae bacterium]
MNPDPNNIIVPDEGQLRILEQVRARLAQRWPTTEVNHERHFQNREDESLDIPPLGESAWLSVTLPMLQLTISTPMPWENGPTTRLRMSFNSYDGGHQGEPWALLLDSKARSRLADAGVEPGKQGRTWSLSDGTELEIADTIVDAVARLAAVPLRVLRRADLPPDVDWPWHGLISLMTADKIVSIEAQPDGKHVITSEIAGRRTEAEVGAKDMQLLRWWWDSVGSSVPDKE